MKTSVYLDTTIFSYYFDGRADKEYEPKIRAFCPWNNYTSWVKGIIVLTVAKKKKIIKTKEWQDPVVEETRTRGRAFTARFGNDIKKISAELRRIAKNAPDKSRYVSEIKIVRKAS